jgi:flavodoxin
MSRSKTSNLTPFDYDLNIFKRELLNGDGEYEHMGPWYIHIYQYDGGNTEEVAEPIELTAEEANALIENDPYFQDHEPDLWYGLEGFLFEKWDAISDRLRYIFECLPKYKEEVLF